MILGRFTLIGLDTQHEPWDPVVYIFIMMEKVTLIKVWITGRKSFPSDLNLCMTNGYISSLV